MFTLAKKFANLSKIAVKLAEMFAETHFFLSFTIINVHHNNHTGSAWLENCYGAPHNTFKSLSNLFYHCLRPIYFRENVTLFIETSSQMTSFVPRL